MYKAVDHVLPLKELVRRKREEQGLTREALAGAIEKLPNYPGGIDYFYLRWLERYRTTIPKGDEDRFWMVAKHLNITEEEIMDSVSEGFRAIIPASFRQ